MDELIDERQMFYDPYFVDHEICKFLWEESLRFLFLGAETCLFALRQYETRSCLFARQYEEHLDLLNVKCRVGTQGQCSKCQLKNSISDFINSCKRYQHETPSYEHFKSK